MEYEPSRPPRSTALPSNPELLILSDQLRRIKPDPTLPKSSTRCDVLCSATLGLNYLTPRPSMQGILSSPEGELALMSVTQHLQTPEADPLIPG
jgi:hypothetical protein